MSELNAIKQLKSFSMTVGRLSLSFTLFKVGSDALGVLTGGDAHLGATAIAQPTDKAEDQVLSLKLPEHREEELARNMAWDLARILKRNVQIIAGVHFDNITEFEIKTVIDIVQHIINSVEDYYEINHEQIFNPFNNG